ncbi:amidase family protein [Sediminicoccus sp. KRV36]|uniref:amidase family protein n=1 Tax=Sediminicoccus sp. KRV36 TaxID=3133721 RepID=UPI00200E5F45|nr:amidase family protein [Sediminicoccus rosea]UPY37877.1 amidase family protein [Sediminicoccus rosea]
MTDLWRLDATDIARLVHTKQVSAREVALSALGRLDAVNPRLNAVIQFMPEQALAAADAVDAGIARGEAPGLLAGVPVTIKVNTDQAGFATTNGLKIQAGAVAREDNPLVSNFRKAGAVIIGRTNTPAFSVRWFTSNDIHGPTFNPRDKGLTPGGSSGGAASATAAGIGAIGHGTDIGGSVRYPAYACGIHGLRPTLGRIPAWNPGLPERDIGPQLMAVSGPLARSIRDLRLGLAAMSAPDPRDPWWVPAPLEGPAMPRRAALCVAPDGMKVAPVIVAALRDAAQRLRAAGWEVEELGSLPPLREPARLQAQLWLSMLPRGGMAAVEQENEPTALAVYRHMQALTPPPGLVEFQDALTLRAGFLRAWNLFFERYPVVLMPVSGELPFPDQADQGGDAAFAGIMEAQLTQVGLPLLGLPGLSVATGLSGTAPLGVQLVGGRYREDLLLAAGEAIAAAGAPPAPIDPQWA